VARWAEAQCFSGLSRVRRPVWFATLPDDIREFMTSAISDPRTSFRAEPKRWRLQPGCENIDQASSLPYADGQAGSLSYGVKVLLVLQKLAAAIDEPGEFFGPQLFDFIRCATGFDGVDRFFTAQ